MFDAIAQILAGFYALPVVGGSYGGAIILLTLAVMVVLMPLTMKATRSTIKMQMVQPEMKRLQKQYRDDRAKMNEELMALYKQHNINPVGGCLPMLAQLPVFLVLFNVLRGLTRRADEAPWFGVTNVVRDRVGVAPLDAETFNPRYLHHDSQLYQSLSADTEMGFGFFDLALHPLDVLRDDFVTAIPYVLLILFVVATAYYQQRQISTRRGVATQMTSQQQALLRIMPLFTGIWSFVFPAGLVVYWATSNVFRIGQQGYITRSLYSHEDAPGRKAIEVSNRPVEEEEQEAPAKSSGAKRQPPTTKPAKDDGQQAGQDARRARRTANGGGDGESARASTTKRSERWSKERAATSRSAPPKQRATTSGRVTPKGSTGTPRKKKRKR
jgi:YidC/Oxa1 family membrane protein insertase